MSMYNYFAKLIKAGADIPETAKRIGMYHLRNVLSDADVESLYEMMDQYADPESNRPEVQVSIDALANRLVTCEQQIKVLQDAVAALGVTGVVPPAEDASDYPDWQPWDGVSRNYRYGDIVRHNGDLWISEWAYQNTWEPGVTGTEKMWVRYTEPAEETTGEDAVAQDDGNVEVEG